MWFIETFSLILALCSLFEGHRNLSKSLLMFRKTRYQPMLVLVLCLCVSTSSLTAQDHIPANSWTVQSASLDVETYEQLAKALKTDTDFKIKEACIPAGLIVFELKENSSADGDRSSQLLNQLQGISTLTDFELSDLSFEGFREKCSAARLRPINK